MLLIQIETATDDLSLLRRIGFDNPTPITLPEHKNQVMAKADDYIVSIARIGDGWISIWGQYDFNMLPDVSAKPVVTKLPEASTIVYYAVEGTSGGLIYERYENGTLVHSYFEVENQPDENRCLGNPPPRDPEYNQVDEWSLLTFALPTGVTYERISQTEHLNYRVSVENQQSTPAETEHKKPWWRIW